MLKINRIKGVSKTLESSFGFDYLLTDSLNLISSSDNTRGKSSVIATIYYCLGFEEIIGGKGVRTLTSVYKSNLTDNEGVSHDVLESEAWLEISNGSDTVTILRTGVMASRSENLISVYYSKLDLVHDSDTFVEDMYIHSKNSTTAKKGFHKFLEKFIGLNLPVVPTTDKREYKLYMQVLFSAIFIEQKRGWADLFSAMPIMRIKDAKKRVIEYLLALDTLSNEKKKADIKEEEAQLINNWKLLVSEIKTIGASGNCNVVGLSTFPKILDSNYKESIQIRRVRGNENIHEYIDSLISEKNKLMSRRPRIDANYEELQKEMEKTEEEIQKFELSFLDIDKRIILEQDSIKKLSGNQEMITSDIQNNKDALKLRNMGSTLGIDSYKGKCPTCRQNIEDSLLPIQKNGEVMTIEENIDHLNSQFDMIKFAIKGHEETLFQLKESKKDFSERLFVLRRLAKSIRNDLFSVDEELSESIVYKRVKLESDIQKFTDLSSEILLKLDKLFELSNEWKNLLSQKEKLPKNNFSDNDKKKINKLEFNFKTYLKEFNYNSSADLSPISISRDNYLPISEGFDMKFDSSASDNIRAIWAYTLALLHTSNETGGNHPKIIIFDEPAQHSIVTNDVVNLFNQVNKLPGQKQVILGITLNDSDIKQAVERYDDKKINVLDVGLRSFQQLEESIAENNVETSNKE